MCYPGCDRTTFRHFTVTLMCVSEQKLDLTDLSEELRNTVSKTHTWTRL